MTTTSKRTEIAFEKPPGERIQFTLLYSGISAGRKAALTVREVKAIWNAIPAIPPEMWPIHRSDGAEVAKVFNVVLIDTVDEYAGIEIEAYVTNGELLAQPWLDLPSICRAAIYFELGRKP